MPPPIPALFTAGDVGTWNVRRTIAIRGDGLPEARALAIQEAPLATLPDARAAWSLRGATGHQRYVEHREGVALAAVQPPLGRDTASFAALIPIRKSEAWWSLAQDERRKIFEDRSHHIAVGLRFLPPIARRLYHCRELGEPFDFLTWFEWSKEHSSLFDELLGALRETEEWTYVEREVEVRLERNATDPTR